MKIIINNREEIIDYETLSLTKLLEVKSFTFKMLVTKVNGKLIKKDERKTTIIRKGDNIAVIHMISGG